MPQVLLIFVEIFYVWGINFMGPFPTSFDFYIHIVGSRLCFQMDGG